MKKALLGLAALVAVLVVAGIIAPSLIDWTRYREQVAIEIERALGRRVIIEGKVAATLLPAPRLSLFGARLGNLPGATAADMAQAEALDIRLALGPLLTGKIVVESVVLRRPVIALEILADGRRNWQFAPSGRTDVRFEDAVISDGTITFTDARSGREERVEGVNGRFSADSLSGPLRAAAELRYRSVPLRFNLSTGRFDPSSAATTPFTLKVYASGGENALHAHKIEDHAFVVLQGRATFYFGDGSSCEALPFEGVMLPKGTLYRFEAGEEENLVLLRIGGAQRKDVANRALQAHGNPMELKGTTFDADGSTKDGRDPKTGTPSLPIIRAVGKFFPKDR